MDLRKLDIRRIELSHGISLLSGFLRRVKGGERGSMPHGSRIRGMADARDLDRGGLRGEDHRRSAVCDRRTIIEAKGIRDHLTLQVILFCNRFSELSIRVEAAVGVILDGLPGQECPQVSATRDSILAHISAQSWRPRRAWSRHTFVQNDQSLRKGSGWLWRWKGESSFLRRGQGHVSYGRRPRHRTPSQKRLRP